MFTLHAMQVFLMDFHTASEIVKTDVLKEAIYRTTTNVHILPTFIHCTVFAWWWPLRLQHV